MLREEKLNHVLESRIYRVFFACGPATKVVTKTPLHKGVTVMKGERVTQVENVYVNRLVSVNVVRANVENFLLNGTERNVETSVTVLNSLHGSWSTFNKRSVNSGRTQANTQAVGN